MFDWLWKGLAALAGMAALWFGASASLTKMRMESEKAEREAAQQKMVEDAYNQLEEARKKHAARAPINTKTRKDFE